MKAVPTVMTIAGSDSGGGAVKTGMLSSAAIIGTVAGTIRQHGLNKLVVDPVMVAKGGDRLLREDAVEELRDMLVPLAQVITSNAPEAQVLTGRKVETLANARTAARDLVARNGMHICIYNCRRSGERARRA